MNQTFGDYSNYRKRIYTGYCNFLSRFDWQWKATLTVNDMLSSNALNQKLISWAEKLEEEEKLEVGYVKAFCENKGHFHLHLLMVGLGVHNEHIVTLENIKPRKWSDKWPFYARIELVKDLIKSAHYIALQKYKFKNDSCEIDFHKPEIIKYFDI